MGDAIETVHVAVYTVPTDQPEADGTLAWDATTVVVLQVGVGPTAGLGFTYGPAACAGVARDLLADVVRGADPMNPPGTSQAMIRAVRDVGRPGIASMAISAVDAALWDLKARLLDLPLGALLGRCRDQVPAYGSGGFTTYDDYALRRQLHHWVDDLGGAAVKIKVGESWGDRPERDLARTRLTRETVGDETDVFVDANGGYTRGQAVRLGLAYDDLGVSWYEEPVSSDDVAGLAMLREKLSADVAAGEYGYHLPDFTRLLDAGAVDCLQIDVTRCGGITEWLRVASLAAGYGLDVSAHCAPSLHVAPAAAVPNLRHVEYFHDHARLEPMIFDGAATMADGGLSTAPGGAGNGLELRAAAEQFRTG